MRIVPEKAAVELIEQSVCHVTQQQKSGQLTSFLRSRPVTRAIVFTRTKHRADRVTQHLKKAGISAAAIHGNKTQAARQRALDGFKANRGGLQVLVATDVAARGIDVDGVSHVLNYDLPHEPEMYVHRIGRTGRAGAMGIALSFCDHEERPQLQAIERFIRRKLRIETDMPDAPAPEPINQPATPARDSRSTEHPRGHRAIRPNDGRPKKSRVRPFAPRAIAPNARAATPPERPSEGPPHLIGLPRRHWSGRRAVSAPAFCDFSADQSRDTD